MKQYNNIKLEHCNSCEEEKRWGESLLDSCCCKHYQGLKVEENKLVELLPLLDSAVPVTSTEMQTLLHNNIDVYFSLGKIDNMKKALVTVGALKKKIINSKSYYFIMF